MGSTSSKRSRTYETSYDSQYNRWPSYNRSQYLSDSPSETDGSSNEQDSSLGDMDECELENHQGYGEHSHEAVHDPQLQDTPVYYDQTTCPSPPRSPINASLTWQVPIDGPILDITFTPGGGHIVAVVKTRGLLEEEREMRIWEVETGLPVEFRENFPRANSSAAGFHEGHNPGLTLYQPRAAGFYGYQHCEGGLHGWSSGSHGGFRNYKATGTTSGKILNHHVSGSFVMYPLWGEAFLRPDDRHLQRRLDFVDLTTRDTGLFNAPKKLWLPMVASPNPGFIQGFDRILVGVDYDLKSVVHVLGSSTTGARLDKQWSLNCDEITHLVFTPSGRSVVSLSRDGMCQWTDIEAGFGACVHIQSNYPADMLQFGQREVYDPASRSGYSTYQHVVSIWGSDVAIWHWTPHQDGLSSLEIYNLNEKLGRRVNPLCMTCNGLYLACGSHNGFDVIEILSGTVVMEGLGRGLYDICQAAFSLDGRNIVVYTADKTVSLFALLDLDRGTPLSF